MADITKVFKNNVNCDIYIGKGAGTQINNDFISVKNELKIVSPFFFDTFTKLILEKLEKSVMITLVFNDDDRLKPLLRKVIRQNYKIDLNEKKRFDELKGQIQILKLLKKILIAFTAVSIFYSNFFSFLVSIIFFRNMPDFSFRPLIFPLGIISVFILNYIIKSKRNTAKNIKTINYTYDYVENLKLKVLKYNSRPENNNNYVNLHSKIFIIDNEIAYLGSLNFTDFGFQYNNETRVKTTDQEVIERLNNHISSLFDNNFESLSIIELANKVYDENCYNEI